MNIKSVLLMVIMVFCVASYTYAAPSISEVAQDNTSIEITGASFGAHSDYKSNNEILSREWHDFEKQSLTNDGDFGVAFGYTDQWSIESGGDTNSSYYAKRFRNESGSDDNRGGLELDNSDNETGIFYIYFKFMHPQNATGKLWRMYWGDSSNRDNHYISPNQGGEQLSVFCESNPVTNKFGGGSIPYGTWNLIEVILDSNTDVIEVYCNGSLVGTDTGWFSDGVYDIDGSYSHIHFGHMLDDAEGDSYNYDDIFVDWTVARVMIGNNSDFSSCSEREIQIPTVWSDGSITVEFNQGGFQDGEEVYLFVIDADGNASEGYPITIGGESEEDVAAPFVSNQSPSASATDVSTTTSVSFTISDAGEGVDYDSIKLYIDDVAMATTITGDAASYTVTTTNEQTFDYGQIVDIKIDAQDLAETPNIMTQVHYTFTVEDDPEVSSQFAVGNEGNADNYTKKTSSRWETVNESGNIVYSINTSDITTENDKMGEYALYADSTYEEFDITLQARSDEDLASNGYADYGVVFGYEDADNYYYVLFNADTSSNDLYRMQDGVRSELVTYDGALIDDNDFHSLRVRYENATVTVYFDGAQVMSLESIILSAGLLGFGSYNDAASFDDVVITDLGAGVAPEDVDGSGTVDATDVGIVKDQVIDKSPDTPAGDVDDSGSVDSIDLQKVVTAID